MLTFSAPPPAWYRFSSVTAIWSTPRETQMKLGQGYCEVKLIRKATFADVGKTQQTREWSTPPVTFSLWPAVRRCWKWRHRAVTHWVSTTNNATRITLPTGLLYRQDHFTYRITLPTRPPVNYSQNTAPDLLLAVWQRCCLREDMLLILMIRTFCCCSWLVFAWLIDALSTTLDQLKAFSKIIQIYITS